MYTIGQSSDFSSCVLYISDHGACMLIYVKDNQVILI